MRKKDASRGRFYELRCGADVASNFLVESFTDHKEEYVIKSQNMTKIGRITSSASNTFFRYLSYMNRYRV